jgi:hypothetical protein
MSQQQPAVTEDDAKKLAAFKTICDALTPLSPGETSPWPTHGSR